MIDAKAWARDHFDSNVPPFEGCELDPNLHVCEVKGGFDV